MLVADAFKHNGEIREKASGSPPLPQEILDVFFLPCNIKFFILQEGFLSFND